MPKSFGRLSFRSFLGWMLLGLGGLCGIVPTAVADDVLTWQAGNPYSDTFLYNGFAYKTIRVFDSRDARFSVTLAAAEGRDNDCPGPGRRCTSSLIMVMNEGSVPFNLHPEDFEVICGGDKLKALKHYVFPKFLRSSVDASGVILLANTVVPGGTKSGAVFFRGSCAEFTLRVRIEVQGRPIVFEFPFESSRR